GVVDVDEVATLGAFAMNLGRTTVEYAHRGDRNYPGQQAIVVLPRTIVVERTDDVRVHTEHAHVAFHGQIRRGLAGGVSSGGIARMGFVHRLVDCRAINLRSGEMAKALEQTATLQLEQV